MQPKRKPRLLWCGRKDRLRSRLKAIPIQRTHNCHSEGARRTKKGSWQGLGGPMDEAGSAVRILVSDEAFWIILADLSRTWVTEFVPVALGSWNFISLVTPFINLLGKHLSDLIFLSEGNCLKDNWEQDFFFLKSAPFGVGLCWRSCSSFGFY